MIERPRRRQPKQKPRLSAEALWEFAVKSLAVRAQTTGELRRKLSDRAEKLEDVETTISRLRDYGYLNDHPFAESFAGASPENQGPGKPRVLRNLRGRKLSPDLAVKAVDQIYKGVDEMELIVSYIRRKV